MARLGRGAPALCFALLCSIIATGQAQLWKDPRNYVHRDRIQDRIYDPVGENERTPGKASPRADELNRLPTALKPSHQYIRLRTFIGGNFSLIGYTEITFEALEVTNTVQFHMLDIITKNQTIQLVDESDLGTPLAFVSHEYNLNEQIYNGTLVDPLIVGNTYIISLEFEGLINDGLGGFYQSVYQDENGDDVLLATTQMEATDARRAFPCFDEPAMKAQFTVELGRELPREAITNMPLVSSTEDANVSGLFWDVFETTPTMSSYLIAFLVSDFVFVNRTTNDGRVLFKIWAREEAKNYTTLAIDHGPDILSFFEIYYGINFPLPKQDMAAIPDFSAGAMENWGLITYREVAVLYSDKESSASFREYVDLVMAHELAHQWFGDLVTMEWWTDLWLNEGFAEYMEFYGMNDVSPEYDIFNAFTINEVHYALSIDDNEGSHPLSTEVNTPNDINAIFDGITYQKGSSVIRMMRVFLTEATFSAALTNYLNTHEYANANQDDLWAAMDAQSHLDGTLDPSITVKEIMDTWTLQMGYPIIDVVFNGDGTADLTQNRFLEEIDPNSTDTHDYKWWVPITWTHQTDPTFGLEGVDDWMTPNDASMSISGLPSNTGWLLINVDQASFYRVNYELNNWDLLTIQLESDHTALSILTRAQLLDDSMNFAKLASGRLPYPTALGITGYLVNELDYVPWVAALDNLRYLEQMFTSESGYLDLKAYLLQILGPFYTYVGFADSLSDPHLIQLSRSLVVSWMCHLENSDCTDQANALYAQWMTDSTANPILPNVKYSVYCSAIAHGAQDEWDFAFARYLETDLASEKDNLIDAMGCSRQAYILTRYLDETFQTPDSAIKYQDSTYVWSSVSGNDYGNEVAWDYLNNNWEEMRNYYGYYGYLAYLASIVTREWNTEAKLTELILFRDLRADDLGLAVATVDGAIETVEKNIEWMDNYYDEILNWLTSSRH